MTAWLSGMEITAERLNDGPTPVVVTTGLTAATGFTVGAFSARKTGHLVELYMILTNTNAITGGNISPDLTVATLPDGYAPAEQINDIFGNGVVGGEFVIIGSEIRLRASWGDISAGTSIRLATMYTLDT